MIRTRRDTQLDFEEVNNQFCSIEGWGAAIAGAAIAGGVASSVIQSGAAGDAASAETGAANEQEATQASIANAELGMEAPSRALGGYAQQDLAYLLGLNPDLNISADLSTPQVNTNGTTNWTTTLGGGGTGADGSSNNGVDVSQGASGAPSGAGIGATTAPNTTQGTVNPQTGTGGYGSLLTGPDVNSVDLQMNPDYQFVLGQNEAQISQAAAAGGHDSVSSGALKNAMNYATGLSSTTYQQAFENAQSNQTNEFNRLASLSGEGQQATAGASSALESGGAGISAAQGAAGSAGAAGAVGIGNALTSGIGTGLSGTELGLLSNNNGFGNNSIFNGLGGGGGGTVPGGGAGTMDAGGGYTYSGLD